MATARSSWTSLDSEPWDIAPVQKRLTISLAGSTWSISIGRPPTKSKSPRSVHSFLD